MATIEKVVSREVLDSRGFPTVEVEMFSSSGLKSRAIVPSGASTGAHEACELRDGDSQRFLGRGVLQAIKNIETDLIPIVMGRNINDQKDLDLEMISKDGTANKNRIGANAILGVSLAVARLAAMEKGQPLYQSLGGPSACQLPVPLMNIINGGAHADNGLDVQEFMIVPRLENFKRSLQAGSEIFHTLKKKLSDQGLTVAVGDEGGFAPKLQSNKQALDFLLQAIEAAGYRPGEEIFLALDVAATEFYSPQGYLWEGKNISAAELTEIYKNWQSQYPMVSIEDGLAEDDWQGWTEMTAQLGKHLQLVGDDLFVTNLERLKTGLEKKCANSLLVKVNQIGTLTEAQQAVSMAQESGYGTVMSHRSGETEDTTIADLSVALNCGQIKTGSLCRSERIAKYNQLLRIEEELGARATFAKLPE